MSDPLLNAVAEGDQACPDGRALANLGALVRTGSAPPRPTDLSGPVQRRVAQLPADSDDDPIDAHYQLGLPDAELEALGGLIRQASSLPRPVDLRARVKAGIAGSRRMSTVLAVQPRSRLRVWHAVVAAHLAAALILALVTFGPERGGRPAPVAVNAEDRGPQIAAATWTSARAAGADLLLSRRLPELRESLRRSAGMDSAKPLVDGGLAWIRAREDGRGRFSTSDPGADDFALAAQAAAVLALLGEGLGDAGRTQAAMRGADLMMAQWTPGTRGVAAEGLACLAAVESALLSGDGRRSTAAVRALQAIPRPVTTQGVARGGWHLLAVRTAAATGMAVDPALAAEVEGVLAGFGRADVSGPTRDGLGAWAARTRGEQVPNPSAEPPLADATGRCDPLSWFFAALDQHSAGQGWEAWRGAMVTSFAVAMVPSGGQVHLPGQHAAHLSDDSDGDLLATSLALLCLQVPYRYLPVGQNDPLAH
ncbi:hypothetical protein LBMAG53_34090 [Planctomycetota bacterium]|nr:hypothetical protein LBMAG53_34090 [Planctomycetota bacterium]